MFTIKVQRIERGPEGVDTVLPTTIRTVGEMPTREAAEAFAAMWSRYDSVAAVWIEVGSLPH